MFYILKSDKSYSKTPEISYGGTSMQFVKGWFIFDTDNTDKNYWERNESSQIEIDSDRFKIYHKISNKHKAEAMFLKLKIDEMQNNGFNFFMPKSYSLYLKDFKQLQQDYPEYII